MYSLLKNKDLSPVEFKLFINLIQDKSGIYIEENRLDTIRISLLARATKYDFHDYIEYYDYLKFGEDKEREFRELLNLITINETSFFRNPAQFKAFQEVVLPEILNKKISLDDRTLRIWAAGCSSGEEPYTIAMVVLNTFFDHWNWKIKILGTDVSANVLETAKNGTYSERSMRLVENHYRKQFFEQKDKDNYTIKNDVKKLVEFKYFNLIETPYPLSEMKNWDVIFCRNVTIYFKKDSTKRVIDNFYNSLNGWGYLFIGHSEFLSDISDKFTLVQSKGAIFYRRGKQQKKLKQILEKRSKIKEEKLETNGYSPISKANKKTEEKKINEGNISLEAVSSEKSLYDIRRNADLLLKKAEALFNKGDIEDAVKTCLEIEAIDPLFLEPYFLLGTIYKKTGNNSEAILQLRKALYINPRYFLAHYYLGDIYQKMGEYQKALIHYNSTIEYLKEDKKDIMQNKFNIVFGNQDVMQTCEQNIKKMEREIKNV